MDNERSSRVLRHDDGHEVRHLGVDRAALMSRRALLRAGGLGLGAAFLAGCGVTSRGSDIVSDLASTSTTLAPSTTAVVADATLPGFAAFASTVRVIRSGDHWLVESSGLPTHPMMVGIRNWQQQVPLPQDYSGANAWRFPAEPKLAATPVSARNALYRGAIAIAVDGIPIFNALNNRGEDATKLGELDRWGGHSGRADDYHYHAAPLYLQEIVGASQPIAYALDGFPIYGSLEPDGSAMRPLDDLNGHLSADGVYHYHGTTTFPYINGGLRGEVSVIEDQVDPQPRLQPTRPSGTPLPGATITAFDASGNGTYRLTYEVSGAAATIDYTIKGDEATFTFTDAKGSSRTEVYRRR